MIHHGDLFDVLPTIDANSIDACVTDPPYGIGFMGREWDTFSPARCAARNQTRRRKDLSAFDTNPNLKGRTRSPAKSNSQMDYDESHDGHHRFQDWTERWASVVLRVLKPGAYLVVCGAPRSYHRMACGLEDAGFVVRDCLAWIFGQGFPKSRNLGNGKGTALKPGYEPIVLAWKPFTGSLTACHAAHGTAALNIDACRIASAPYDAPGDRGQTSRQRQSEFAMTSGSMSDLGRWPANVVLDDDAATELDEQTGELTSGANPERRSSDKFSDVYGAFKGQTCDPARGMDVGGASRFFYCAKPDREERDYGTAARNIHPTVKPVALMRWLVKLVTPLNGTVLDPFLGSGTTGMACRYEQRAFVGIEREAEYVQIAGRRIAAVAPLFMEHLA